MYDIMDPENTHRVVGRIGVVQRKIPIGGKEREKEKEQGGQASFPKPSQRL